MSSKCWQEILKTNFRQQNKRLVVVGIGHELRGDDALGVIAIQQLQQHCSQGDSLLLLNAASAPENITGSIRRFMPDTVLLIDAVAMQQAAGHIEMVDCHNIRETAASTHTLSLRLFADYLHSEMNCEVFLLGIQPLSTAFDAALSEPVQASVRAVVDHLQTMFASPHVTSVMNES